MVKTAEQRGYLLRDNDIVVTEKSTPYVLRVRDRATEDKPREKLTALGPKNMDSTELIAILLGTGTRKEEVMVMAGRIVKEYGEKAIQYETQPQKLAEVLDIPLSKACQIVASFELGRRFFESKDGLPIFVRTASQAYDHLRDIAYSKKEQLRGLYLSSRYEIIYDEVISVGTLTANLVHPREVFRPAIERSAVAIIIAHNHPSGDAEPTADDITITSQLVAAGSVLGIDLIDHLVIGPDKYISIMEKNNE